MRVGDTFPAVTGFFFLGQGLVTTVFFPSWFMSLCNRLGSDMTMFLLDNTIFLFA